MSGWSDSAVVYEIYPRSFQDSDGDGIGDLPGITGRMEYLEWLGVDAIWLAPIYASPLADYGYDVSDHEAIDPEYGTLADFDELVAAAHARRIRVVLDLVVSHTSIEHRWFRERPDFYVWADGPEPPNNWRASFGGPAWSRDPVSGRLYLHSFYVEQPDLDWRNPEVREAMSAVVRFWTDRGVDGFRVDAVDRMVKDEALRDDPPAAEPFPLPMDPEVRKLDLIHSRDSPAIPIALAALRAAAGERAAVRGGLSAGRQGRPLSRLLRRRLRVRPAALAVASGRDRPRDRPLERGRKGRLGDVKSRLPPSCIPVGRRERPGGRGAAADARRLGLRLPGRGDRDDRRRARRTATRPLRPRRLPAADAVGPASSAASRPAGRGCRRSTRASATWPSSGDDPASVLHLFRRLIALRREIAGDPRRLDAPSDALMFARGEHLIAVNLGATRARCDVPAGAESALATTRRRRRGWPTGLAALGAVPEPSDARLPESLVYRFGEAGRGVARRRPTVAGRER